MGFINVPDSVRALLVAGLAALALGTWLPCDARGDDLQYALHIRGTAEGRPFFHPAGRSIIDSRTLAPKTDVPPNPWPINPRYPLDWPTSLAAVRTVRSFVPDADVQQVVVATRVVAAALALGLFFLTLVVSTNDRIVSGLATAGLGTSVSFWTFATHADQSMTAILWSVAGLLVLGGLLLGRVSGWAWYVALAIATVLGVLYNLTIGITAVVFWAAAVWKWRGQSEGPTFSAARGPIVLAVGVVMLAAAVWAVVPRPSPSDLLQEVLFIGRPEHRVSLEDVPRAVLGFARSHVGFPGLRDSFLDFWRDQPPQVRAVAAGFYAVVLLVLFWPCALLWRYRAHLGPERPLVGVMGGWLSATGLFALFWDPGFIKYWLLPVVAWWALAGLVVARHRSVVRSAWPVAGLAGVLLVQATMNVAVVVRPATTCPSTWQTCAESLDDTPVSSLFLTPGHPIDFRIIYHVGRNVVSPWLVEYAGAGPEESRQIVARHIRAHLALGGPVFALGDEPGSRRYSGTWARLSHTPRQLVRTCSGLDVYLTDARAMLDVLEQ